MVSFVIMVNESEWKMSGEPRNRRNRTRNADPGAVKGLLKRGRLVLRLMGDERVPFLLKGLPVFSLLYLISPFDFIPEALVLVLGPIGAVGALDDVAVILLILNLFISLAPPDVVAEHQRELAAQGDWQADDAPASDDSPGTIEGSFRIVDGEEG